MTRVNRADGFAFLASIRLYDLAATNVDGEIRARVVTPLRLGR
jgi:hypothetical protein